ncbi:uncharacterized protein LOC128682163 [Plodia interpunctella]|uniref:uncharacterized protein LOC128682163 n=1 Tax=Plodia interpunctella TaxID=58824 RepID=UPI0023687531|nr:uncharacterized protein LOC128682163 [Plodia interpunctella]
MAGYTTETRLCQPSLTQVDVLLSFLETHVHLANGYSKTQRNKERSQKEWSRITSRLNNVPDGSMKTVKRWMKYWSDKKGAVKKKQAAIEKLKEEGRVEEIPELSETEERILALLRAGAIATAAPTNRTRVKTEPIDIDTVESSQNNTVTTFVLEHHVEEETDDDINDSEDRFLSAYRFNDSTEMTTSKQDHTPTVSSTRPEESTFLLVADKLCQIEQQRLDLDRRMLEVLERNSERDVVLAEAVKAMGEGLKAIAEAITKK